jgi:O-antigen/teichoic acid export membrane protein
MVLARKIAYNVVLNSLLKVTSTVVLSLLSIRLMTGYLGQEGFGKYATILAFFAFFTALADLGLGSVTAREISREGADEGRILGNVVALRLVSSIASRFAPIIVFSDYGPEVKIGILIAALTVFSTLSLCSMLFFRRI